MQRGGAPTTQSECSARGARPAGGVGSWEASVGCGGAVAGLLPSGAPCETGPAQQLALQPAHGPPAPQPTHTALVQVRPTHAARAARVAQGEKGVARPAAGAWCGWAPRAATAAAGPLAAPALSAQHALPPRRCPRVPTPASSCLAPCCLLLSGGSSRRATSIRCCSSKWERCGGEGGVGQVGWAGWAGGLRRRAVGSGRPDTGARITRCSNTCSHTPYSTAASSVLRAV